ncbi:acyl-CoA dehydrogenase family protein [Streptomyces sp. DSM 44915]|uniref:Acyl-CoA dehydrogenase family protein n=1 Tax=Streptomyces chisholmiae TaxID=3075540 RepID=A0ABU2JVK3_9ACTN|nr:acyl-CoA dehydrogenase family protein [Streptomyces sp. DSM 44915]MDT0268994.1 acyl-CoA dehydrogenase family protein [Streptomyces sp. DSM 44915]
MSAPTTAGETATAHPADESATLRAWFGDRAAPLDQGTGDTRAGLRWLGEHGLLARAAPAGGDAPLTDSVRLVEEVSACCLSSGFSLWAQLMATAYLDIGRPGAFTRAWAPRLRAGTAVGCTALAPALRDVAGLEPVPVEASPEPGGLRLDGPVRWASNLFPGAVVVLPVRRADGRRAVVGLTTDTPGVTVHQSPALLALGATASTSLTLEGVRIPDDAVLASDLPAFVARVRPTFLLLQSAFCVGLAGAALRAAEGRLTGVNATLAPDAEEADALHRSVRDRLHQLAAAPALAGRRELLRLRLDAARAAGLATRLESALLGGAGYARGSATNRRLREAAFLPIQSPTEGQLRWELSQSD